MNSLFALWARVLRDARFAASCDSCVAWEAGGNARSNFSSALELPRRGWSLPNSAPAKAYLEQLYHRVDMVLDSFLQWAHHQASMLCGWVCRSKVWPVKTGGRSRRSQEPALQCRAAGSWSPRAEDSYVEIAVRLAADRPAARRIAPNLADAPGKRRFSWTRRGLPDRHRGELIARCGGTGVRWGGNGNRYSVPRCSVISA